MRRLALMAMVLGGLISASARAQEAAPAPAPAPVEVMVLGTWHFDNPGQDVHNVRADDVLASNRQAELEAIAAAIAEFRPTKVMVERVARTPDLVDPNFAAFRLEHLRSQRDERVQLGYRIARLAGLDRVYAIDEQAGEGEPDYFPFGAVAQYAQANDLGERLGELMARGEAATRAFEERQRTAGLAELLAGYNDPAGFESGIGNYYELLQIGGTEQQPGAVLNAMWYMRNAKIFGKLATVAEPGDRILVVYGAGHNYWLRHFASETPGFASVDPIPYLRRAAGR